MYPLRDDLSSSQRLWNFNPVSSILFFFYLAAPGLSRGTRDLRPSPCRIFSYSIWELVPRPETKPSFSTLETRSLGHSTGEVPVPPILVFVT